MVLAECACKTGSYCFTLNEGGKGRQHVCCAKKSVEQEGWIDSLIQCGVFFKEEEFHVNASSIFEFSAKDIDGNEVTLDKYKGKVCIVTNVASE